MHYSSYVHPHLAIYLDSPFGCDPTFQTLISVRQKRFQYNDDIYKYIYIYIFIYLYDSMSYVSG